MTKADSPALPRSGGSYERQSDGSLKPKAAPKAAPAPAPEPKTQKAADAAPSTEA